MASIIAMDLNPWRVRNIAIVVTAFEHDQRDSDWSGDVLHHPWRTVGYTEWTH
jgi:hypothetical protein